MKTISKDSCVTAFFKGMYNSLRFIRNVAFATLVIISSLPLVFFYALDFIVTFVVKRFYKDLSPMTPSDRGILSGLDMDIGDPNSKNLNVNFGITCKLNGKVDGESFFQTFVKKVINIDDSKPLDPNHDHIRFHKSVARFCGYWFFKTFPKLKYEDHVTCAVLPNNSSHEEEISKWLKIRYDINKCPLWGILLIYREESHDTIFAFKIHHLLADGYSLLHILDLLTDTQYKYVVRDANNETRLQKFYIMVTSMYAVFKRYFLILFVPKSPLCPDDEEIFMANLTVPVSTVKNIRRENNVRFQSVIQCIMLNYIQSVITDIKGKDIPNKIAITCSLPVPNHPRIKLCNHAIGVILNFGKRESKTSPKECLQNVNDVFEDCQQNFLDRASLMWAKPLSVVPVNSSRLSTSVAVGMKNKVSGAFIPMIGSEEYLRMLDIECSDVRIFGVPSHQKGVVFMCFTTSNEVRITVLGPKSIFPSQDTATQFSQESFQRSVAELTVNSQ